MLQPFLSDYFGKGESENVMILLKKSKKIIIILSVLLSILFLSSSNLIISFYGKSYYEASKVLVILILPVIFININALNRQFLISVGKIWQIAIINFISATTIITSFLLLEDNYSLSVSFAVSVGIGEFLSFCLYLYALKFLFKKKANLLT
jgi:O-antigen/teichoic acid export membrane protein